MTRRPQPTLLWRWLRRLFFLAGMIALLFILAAYLFWNFGPAAYKAANIDISGIDEYAALSVVYDETGKEIGEVGTFQRYPITYDDLPQHLIDAVTACEDRRFWDHGGIDPIGILRAMIINVISLEAKQGGSSITQQLAKVYTGDFSKTLERKIVDMHLALRIEENYTKKEILTAYLNRIYFGSGCYGVEAAARGYFGKSVKELTLSESAVLAGIIPAPSVMNPRANLFRAKERRLTALQDMFEAGKITRKQQAQAWIQPVKLADNPDDNVNTHLWSMIKEKMAWQLELDPEKDELPGGLKVYTTINQTLQDKAAKFLQKHFNAHLDEVPETLRKQMLAKQADAAMAVFEIKSGSILAYVGGIDFGRNQFDALRMGRWGAPVLYSPIMVPLGQWSTAYEKRDGLPPKNADGKAKRRIVPGGNVSRRVADGFVRLLKSSQYLEEGQRLDSAQDERGLAELSLMDFAAIYIRSHTGLAHKNVRDLRLIRKIVGPGGRNLEQTKPSEIPAGLLGVFVDKQGPFVTTSLRGDLSAWAVGIADSQCVVIWTGFRGPLPVEARETLEHLPEHAVRAWRTSLVPSTPLPVIP